QVVPLLHVGVGVGGEVGHLLGEARAPLQHLEVVVDDDVGLVAEVDDDPYRAAVPGAGVAEPREPVAVPAGEVLRRQEQRLVAVGERLAQLEHRVAALRRRRPGGLVAEAVAGEAGAVAAADQPLGRHPRPRPRIGDAVLQERAGVPGEEHLERAGAGLRQTDVQVDGCCHWTSSDGCRRSGRAVRWASLSRTQATWRWNSGRSGIRPAARSNSASASSSRPARASARPRAAWKCGFPADSLIASCCEAIEAGMRPSRNCRLPKWCQYSGLPGASFTARWAGASASGCRFWRLSTTERR